VEWITEVVEWKFLKVYYQYLHLNISQLAYLHILKSFTPHYRPNLFQVTFVIYLIKSTLNTVPTYPFLENFPEQLHGEYSQNKLSTQQK